METFTLREFLIKIMIVDPCLDIIEGRPEKGKEGKGSKEGKEGKKGKKGEDNKEVKEDMERG